MSSLLERDFAPPMLDNNDATLRDYLGVLVVGWKGIIAIALAGLLIGVYASWTLVPTYEATAMMRVARDVNLAPQELLDTQSASDDRGLASAEAKLTESRTVLKAVVESLGLQLEINAHYFPIFGEALARFRSETGRPMSNLFGLKRYAWGGESISVTEFSVADVDHHFELTVESTGEDSFRLLNTSGKLLSDGLVGQVLKAGGDTTNLPAFSVQISHLTAPLGTRFSLRHVRPEVAIESLRARLNTDESPQGSGLLNLVLSATTRSDAELQLRRLMQAYVEQSVSQRSRVAEERLKFLQSQLPGLELRRQNAESALRAYQTANGTINLSRDAEALLGRMAGIDAQYAEVELNRQGLLRNLTPGHPEVSALAGQLRGLSKQRTDLDAEIRKLPPVESKLLELSREVTLTSELYQEVMHSAQELQVTKEGFVGQVQIVDEAYAPNLPAGPKRVRVTVLLLILGILAGVAVVVLRHLFSKTLNDPEALKKKGFGAPVATIPYSAEQREHESSGDSQPLALATPSDAAIEGLRSLRTSLELGLVAKENRLIGVTGPTPGCGKSFVSANLAVLLAQIGRKVMLVDADLRRGKLHQMFRPPQSQPGLVELLKGTATLDEAIYEDTVEGLSVISRGGRTDTPSELLMNPNLETVLETLSQRFDYVILDLPPVLGLADAKVAAGKLKSRFVVVRSRLSTTHELEHTLGDLSRDGIAVDGLILNALDAQLMSSAYGRYRHYAHNAYYGD